MNILPIKKSLSNLTTGDILRILEELYNYNNTINVITPTIDEFNILLSNIIRSCNVNIEYTLYGTTIIETTINKFISSNNIIDDIYTFKDNSLSVIDLYTNSTYNRDAINKVLPTINNVITELLI